MHVFYNKIIQSIVSLMLIFSVSSLAASTPEAVVKTVINESIKNHHLSEKAFEKFFKSKLMRYVDYKYASYKILGPYMKQTTKKERNDFSVAFESYIARSLALTMSKYNSQKITYSPTKIKDKFAVVSIKIKDANGTTPVSFSLRQSNNTWKIYDILASNVSILSSKQKEFSGILRSKGVAGAIAAMK